MRFKNNYSTFLKLADFHRTGISEQGYQELKNTYCDKYGFFKVVDLLSDYCKRDVKTLLLGFERYLDIIISRFQINPLDGTVTLSSVSYKIWPTHYMSANLVHVIDSSCTLSNNSAI